MTFADGDVNSKFRAGVDIGGTFTDIVLRGDRGLVLTHKVSSTPDDYGRGIVIGLNELCARHGISPDRIAEIVHGTTIATNTILEGKGARTALITTRGFRDVLELRRVRIPELYNMFLDRPPALVPRRLRYEVTERIDYRGRVQTTLAEDELASIFEAVAQAGVEALAICLLHAYANPEHEQRIQALARRALGEAMFICTSSQVLPEIKEYERTSTTVINAYIGPAVRHYCQRLSNALFASGYRAPIRIMQSSGGILSIEEVLQLPAYIVESGPAAGVIGAACAASRMNHSDVLTIDMGGTTAKASMVEGATVARTNEYEVGAGINLSSKLVKGGGHALKLPVIDISEIGAGGGSIARVSPHGTLSVGPDSAGAVPGPACYGRGGSEATLTDAMVCLGYVSPTQLVGGAMKIDGALSRSAVERLVAKPLDMSVIAAAHGVFQLASATMTRAVKAVSTFRGRDPRDFALFAFGGNGALMAASIADALEIRSVIVPRFAGVFSALGLLDANLERDMSRTWMQSLDQLDGVELEQRYADIESELRKAYAASHGAAGLSLRRTADLRYRGQAFELNVMAPQTGSNAGAVLRERFVSEHRRTYGHGSADDPIDLVNIRVTATLPVERRPDAVHSIGRSNSGSVHRDAFFGAKLGLMSTRILRRANLSTRQPGPLIIEEDDATVLVPPHWSAELGADAAILMNRNMS